MTVITGQVGGRTALNNGIVSLSCLSGSSNCEIIGDTIYMVGTLAGEAGVANQLGKGTTLIKLGNTNDSLSTININRVVNETISGNKTPNEYANLLDGYTVLPDINGGSYSGSPAKILNDMEADNIRALTRENETAQILADKGYHVQQGGVSQSANNTKPDLRINGEIYDVYSPFTDKVRNLWDEALKKVGEGQTNRIVINLSDSPLNVSDVQRQFQTWGDKGLGLENVIALDKNGNVHNIWTKGR